MDMNTVIAKWLNMFLVDRSQSVLPVLLGVTQGTYCGPLIFNQFVNDNLHY